MSNPFKIGDKITINAELDAKAAVAAVDTTKDRVYILSIVGRAYHSALEIALKQPSEELAAVGFVDDSGEDVELHYKDVTLAEE